ncbi:MAG: RNA polymerase sigma factor [Pseudonocardiaceae bacterium]
MERTGRGRAAASRAAAGPAAATRTGGGADTRTAQAPQLRVVGDEFYPDWEAVYRDNVDRVYRLMYAKVGNRPDAEDLTAEVFLAALRPLRVSASVAEVRAYLLATARTVLAGYWRRTLGREITTLTDDDTLEAVLPDTAASGDAVTQAAVILAELPENYRRILELRFLESCSVREAASAMGVSLAYAKVLQHRALRRAAQLLEVKQ